MSRPSAVRPVSSSRSGAASSCHHQGCCKTGGRSLCTPSLLSDMSKLIRVPTGYCRWCEREFCQRPTARTPPASRKCASISKDSDMQHGVMEEINNKTKSRLSKSSVVLSVPGFGRRLASSNQRAGSCDKEVLHQPRITRQGSA